MPRFRLLTIPLLLALTFTAVPAHAVIQGGESGGEGGTAGEPSETLSVTPLTHAKDGYFSVALSAGESAELTLRVGTSGEDLNLNAYATNALPMVNGGFAADKPDAPAHGPTTWVTGPEEPSFALTGERDVTFTVELPEAVGAGEYAVAIVVATDAKETHAEPIRQRIEQVVPLNIVIAGRTLSAFSFGDTASHRFTPEGSAINFDVRGEGNLHVSPAGTIEVLNGTGAIVSATDLEMRSIYTGTTAQAEIVLGDPLLAGDYTLNVDMRDAKSDAEASREGIPFTVDGSSEFAGDEKNLPAVIQEAPNAWLLPVIAGLLVVLIAGVAFLLMKRRKSD